jgi:predicted SAM-dependent methyltransferase
MKLKDALQLLAWEGVNPVLLGLKKRRRYHFNGTYRGINLGCGMDNPANWLGIDGGVYVLMHSIPKPVLKLAYRVTTAKKGYTEEEYLQKIRGTKVLHFDLAHGIPFQDASVPAVYSSHFFEHITKKNAERLMRECFRVLKPGGMIRIVVPSLESEVRKMREAVEHYEQGDVAEVQKYLTSNIIGYNNAYNNHRWMYNFQEMREALERAGFTDVVERTFREGMFPDVETIETRGGLAVEAVKPAASE